MTFQESYKKGSVLLDEAGISESSVDAWYLLEYAAGISRARYFAGPDRQMEPKQERRYFDLIRKRSLRIPLQHLTGVQEFMGLEFLVNEHVLIPRQDTEVLVEEALKFVNERQNVPVRILDLCTGSGCVLLSILKLAYKKEGLSGAGTDVSEKALCTARMNAEKLGVNAFFVQSDLFCQVKGTFDMIVSNPPYIPTAEISMLQEEVRSHDPYLALDGGEDGLYFYREILKGCEGHLVSGGFLLFEIGWNQAESVRALMEQAGYRKIQVKKDLAGLDRVISGVYDVKDE